MDKRIPEALELLEQAQRLRNVGDPRAWLVEAKARVLLRNAIADDEERAGQVPSASEQHYRSA